MALRHEPQSLNRYNYVVNNPTNLIDPLGLWHCEFGFCPGINPCDYLHGAARILCLIELFYLAVLFDSGGGGSNCNPMLDAPDVAISCIPGTNYTASVTVTGPGVATLDEAEVQFEGNLRRVGFVKRKGLSAEITFRVRVKQGTVQVGTLRWNCTGKCLNGEEYLIIQPQRVVCGSAT